MRQDRYILLTKYKIFYQAFHNIFFRTESFLQKTLLQKQKEGVSCPSNPVLPAAQTKSLGATVNPRLPCEWASSKLRASSQAFSKSRQLRPTKPPVAPWPTAATLAQTTIVLSPGGGYAFFLLPQPRALLSASCPMPSACHLQVPPPLSPGSCWGSLSAEPNGSQRARDCWPRLSTQHCYPSPGGRLCMTVYLDSSGLYPDMEPTGCAEGRNEIYCRNPPRAGGALSYQQDGSGFVLFMHDSTYMRFLEQSYL